MTDSGSLPLILVRTGLTAVPWYVSSVGAECPDPLASQLDDADARLADHARSPLSFQAELVDFHPVDFPSFPSASVLNWVSHFEHSVRDCNTKIGAFTWFCLLRNWAKFNCLMVGGTLSERGSMSNWIKSSFVLEFGFL